MAGVFAEEHNSIGKQKNVNRHQNFIPVLE